MQLPTSRVPNSCAPCVCLLTCLQAIAPASHTATAATSTLCKVLTWHLDHTWQDAAAAGATPRLMHQADWLAYLLHGEWGQLRPLQAVFPTCCFVDRLVDQPLNAASRHTGLVPYRSGAGGSMLLSPQYQQLCTQATCARVLLLG